METITFYMEVSNSHDGSDNLAKRIRIGKRLGEGQHASVLEGICDGDMAFAVKIFKRKIWFRTELDILRNIRSIPGCIRLVGFVDTDPRPCIVLPRYDLTLRERLGSTPSNSERRQSLSHIIPVFQALRGLHLEVGFHRDINPQNILWRYNCDYVLSDFGQLLQHSKGTPHEACYSAYARRNENAGTWSDVWALAVVCLELLVWISGGHDAVKNFKSERERDQIKHSLASSGCITLVIPFFDIGDKLCGSVVERLEALSKEFSDQVSILKDMMKTNHEKRITMEEASERWEAALKFQ